MRSDTGLDVFITKLENSFDYLVEANLAVAWLDAISSEDGCRQRNDANNVYVARKKVKVAALKEEGIDLDL